MPVMDGYEATRVIRQQESAGRRLPIIALAANALAADRARCLAAGMDTNLAKPLHPEQLKMALQRWLSVDDAAPDNISSPRKAG
ncbi:MAG: response regulator [Chloroflexota bacterium]